MLKNANDQQKNTSEPQTNDNNQDYEEQPNINS